MLIKQIENNKEIKEIFYKKKENIIVTYSNLSISAIIIVVLLSIIIIKKLKKNQKLVIQENTIKFIAQESNNLKDGGVIYPTNNVLGVLNSTSAQW